MAETPGGADNEQMGTSDEAEGSTDPTADQIATGDTLESGDVEKANLLNGGADRTNAIAASGMTLGTSGLTLEAARRHGTERYAEAEFAERVVANVYADKVGGTVVEDSSSVFAPDGGIDGIVETSSGRKFIQSKHHGQEVGNNILGQYSGDIDALGATNGVAESADPESYGMDVITADDWPLRAKAKLEARRVAHGCRKGVSAIKKGTRAVVGRLLDVTKFVGRKVVAGGKWFGRRLIKIGSVIAAWFTRRSLITQLLLVVVVVGALYLLWRWYTSED